MGFVQENRAVLVTFGASVAAILGAKVLLTPGIGTADAALAAASLPPPASAGVFVAPPPASTIPPDPTPAEIAARLGGMGGTGAGTGENYTPPPVGAAPTGGLLVSPSTGAILETPTGAPAPRGDAVLDPCGVLIPQSWCDEPSLEPATTTTTPPTTTTTVKPTTTTSSTSTTTSSTTTSSTTTSSTSTTSTTSTTVPTTTTTSTSTTTTSSTTTTTAP